MPVSPATVTPLLTGGYLAGSDRLLVMEQYRSTADPPFTAAADLAAFEGGTVDGIVGQVITLTAGTIREAIDPSDRSIDFGTSLTVDRHIGRHLYVWDGVAVGNLYPITDNAAGTITVTGNLASVSAGDRVVIVDHLSPADGGYSDFGCERGIDSLSASFSATVLDVGDGDALFVPQAMSWLLWQKRLQNETTTTGWFNIGLFCVDTTEPGERVGSASTPFSATDPLKWFSFQPFAGIFRSDVIHEDRRLANYGTGVQAVVLTMIDDEVSGTDGYYRFVHSPLGNDPLSGTDQDLADHTRNWTEWAPTFYRSDNTGSGVTGTDLYLPNNEAIQVLSGQGEVRITARYFQEHFLPPSGTQPYLKAQYSRYATSQDQVRGTVTALSGTGDVAFTDTSLPAALQFPAVGAGATDMTVRFTSGAAIGQTVTVTANTATSLTTDTDLGTAGVTAGDGYELGGINDPRRIVEDLLADSGFQRLDDSLPMYVDTLDEITISANPEMVYLFDTSAATYTDVTSAVKDKSTTSAIPHDTGDIVYIGHTAPFPQVSLTLPTPFVSATWAFEYFQRGGTWAALPSYGLTDGTSNLSQSGILSYNVPSDWGTASVNSSGYYYWLRLRLTNNPAAAPTVSRLVVLDRPSADVLDVREVDNRTPASLFDDLRSGNLIPPNWILYCDPDGVVQGANVVQAAAADWTHTLPTEVSSNYSDNDLKTGVLYRGWVQEENAVSALDGASIDTTDELDVKLTTAAAGAEAGNLNLVNPGFRNDFALGLNCLIDGDDPRDADRRTPGTYTFSGSWEMIHHWRYGCYWPHAEQNAWKIHLYNLPLFWIDFGQAYDRLGKVVAVIDGVDHVMPIWTWDDEQFPPTFSIEASGDAPPYSGMSWVPLCDEAQAVQVDPAGIKEYIFTEGQNGWPSPIRAIRFTSVVPGWSAPSNGHDYHETPSFIAVKAYRSQELQSTFYLGDTAPFTATYYTNLIRRYGKRLWVSPGIDYSADSQTKVDEKAREFLDELAHRFTAVPLAGIRPDARLFQTVQLTRANLRFTNKLVLLTDVSIGPGVQMSAVGHDYRLGEN